MGKKGMMIKFKEITHLKTMKKEEKRCYQIEGI
jgi:hypothetical protein